MKKYVIIPCLGLSTRFAQEGFTGPKALLPVRCNGVVKPMIQWIVDSLPPDWSPLIVAPVAFWRSFVGSTGGGVSVMVVHEPTQGQSDTIARAVRSLLLDGDGPAAVHNCDLLLDQSNVSAVLATDDNVAVVHHDDGPDPIFSYVGGLGRTSVFAEKQRISPWAMTGLWRFRRLSALGTALDTQIASGVRHENGEFYLSGALGFLVNGVAVHPVRQWVDWGTPGAVHASGCEITA